jgi:type I restriction enzyme S subunit
VNGEVRRVKRICPVHWDVLPFVEAIKDVSSGNPKIKEGDYFEKGALAVIDQGKDFIGGYVDDVNLACKEQLPCLLFGDHTKIFKYVDFPFALGADGVKVLSPTTGFDKRFVYHYLNTLRLPDNVGYSRHYKFLKEKAVPKPPLSEQKRIAAILDKADAIRRKRQQAIKLADDFLRSVFLDMFGDLIKNSKRWDIVRFGDVGQLRLGKMLDAKQQTGNNRRQYLRNANIQWDRIDLSGLLEMDFGPKDRQIFKLKHGDLLVCEGGEVGRSAIWRDELPECYFQKALHRIRPNTKKATPEFLLHLMWFFARNGGFKDHTSSVTIPHLTGVKLKDMRIPLPPLNLQEKFSQRYYAVRKIKDRSWKLSALGDNLFGSLTQRAFRGEL